MRSYLRRGLKVVIDTNALENDRYARRPVAEAAWRGAEAGDFDIVVPEVVIQELVKHFPTALSKTLESLSTALQERGRELDTFGITRPTMPDIDFDSFVASYETNLRARCSAPGCQVASVPDLGPALSWAVMRRKPFDSNGHGLPDAAIWLTVLDLARSSTVILVTNNHKDFGRPGSLPAALREDLVLRSIPEDRIQIVSDLFALRREIVTPAAAAIDRAERLLDTLKNRVVTDRIARAVGHSAVEPSAVGLDLALDNPPVLAGLAVDAFIVSDARELGDGAILARLNARCDAGVELVVYRDAYAAALSQGVEFETFDPSANGMNGRMWISADITVDAVLRIDGSVDEVSLREFRRVAPEVELQRAIDQNASEPLIEALLTGSFSMPPIRRYRPPEAIAGPLEHATVEAWRVEHGFDVVEVLEVLGRDERGGIRAVLDVAAVASVSWLAGSPTPQDLDEFRALAEGLEQGGGYLRGTAEEEELTLVVTGTLTPFGWEEIAIVRAALCESVATTRRHAAAVRQGQDRREAHVSGSPGSFGVSRRR